MQIRVQSYKTSPLPPSLGAFFSKNGTLYTLFCPREPCEKTVYAHTCLGGYAHTNILLRIDLQRVEQVFDRRLSIAVEYLHEAWFIADSVQVVIYFYMVEFAVA